MRESRAEIKAGLLANYEGILDEMLSQGETKARLALTDIEPMALRAEVGERVTAALVEIQRPAPWTGRFVGGKCWEACFTITIIRWPEELGGSADRFYSHTGPSQANHSGWMA